MKVLLLNSPRKDKKFRVIFADKSHVDFGQEGYSDYTIHKDPERMRRYLVRHGRGREKWSIRGIKTAGFWSRWLLWSKPSLAEAKMLIKKKFGITQYPKL